MTTPPIPTSIADAGAAHDRHRLSVLDTLLDEATPTAVRELLGAALDLCATLYADRDEREAAITATFAKHRAERDAATGQLAAARQVIDEERATVARLTARVAELEARPVLKVERLAEALDAHGHAALARKVFAHLGPVTLPLPAQDRAEELTRAYGIEAAAVTGSRRDSADSMRRALASLGAPATTPTAAPGLLAAVSVEELIGVYGSAYNECSCSDGRFDDPSCCNKAAIRAILARLDATTIAPVDPREFALVLIMRDLTDDNGDMSTTAVAAAARYALTAAGIP